MSKSYYAGRLFPPLKWLYDGDDEEYLNNLYEAMEDISVDDPCMDKLSIAKSDTHPVEEMASSPTQRMFLQLLIRIGGYESILEIGTFVGVTTMDMARAMHVGGKVTTIERYYKFAELARQNFKDNELDGKIELIEGDALDILTKDQFQMFDMIFLDGNKERYHEYFELLDKRLEVGGIMVVDDVFMHGDIFNNPPNTKKGVGVKKFLKLIKENKRYRKLLLPIENGVLLLLKVMQ